MFTSAGPATVTVTNAIGCTGTAAPIDVVINAASQPVIAAAGPTSVCDGETVTLNVTNTFDSYLWPDGSSGNSYVAVQSGSYQVSVTSAAGCPGVSNSIEVYVNPVPAQPTISQSQHLLFTDVVGNLQWLEDGMPVVGANAVVFEPDTSGTFTVSITSDSGCVAESDPFVYIAPVIDVSVGGGQSATLELQLVPNPARQTSTLWFDATQAGDAIVRVLGSNGQLVHQQRASVQAGRQQVLLPLHDLATGIYFVELQHAGERSFKRLVIQD